MKCVVMVSENKIKLITTLSLLHGEGLNVIIFIGGVWKMGLYVNSGLPVKVSGERLLKLREHEIMHRTGMQD